MGVPSGSATPRISPPADAPRVPVLWKTPLMVMNAIVLMLRL